MTIHQNRRMAVLGLLREAARAGAPCPKNADICGQLHFGSPSGPAEAIATLERQGLIRVERFQNARQVTIVATGESTALPAFRAKHWRDRPQAEQTDPDALAAARLQRRQLRANVARHVKDHPVALPAAPMPEATPESAAQPTPDPLTRLRALAGGRFLTCQYIAGDPKIDPAKCGKPSRPGSDYCEHHHIRCHARVTQGAGE